MDSFVARTSQARAVVLASLLAVAWLPRTFAQSLPSTDAERPNSAAQTAAQAEAHWAAVAGNDPAAAQAAFEALDAAAARNKLSGPSDPEPLRRRLVAAPNVLLIHAVGLLRDRDSVPALIAILNGRSPTLRAAAAEALGAIRDPAAVEPILVVMQAERETSNDDHRLTVACIRALEALGDPRAVPALLALVEHSANTVRMWPPQSGGNSIDLATSSALIALGPQAIKPLADALDDDSANVRASAARTLHGMRMRSDIDEIDIQPAIEPLVAAMTGDDPIVRNYAVLILGDWGDKRALPGLLEFLRSEEDDGPRGPLQVSRVADVAGLYVARMQAHEAVPLLIEMLAHGGPRARVRAATALAMLRDERAIEPLLPLLDDPDDRVRIAAIQAFGPLKAEAAVKRLIPLLTDDSPAIRSEAATALGRIGGDGVADALVPLLNDENISVKYRAAAALAWLGEPRAAEIVLSALDDPDEERRGQIIAAAAPAFSAREEILAPLVKALGDSSIDVRHYAAYSLGRMSTDSAVDALIAKLDDRENLPNILKALGMTKHERAFPILVTHLDDADAANRVVAAYQLGASGEEEYAAELAKHLDDPSPEMRLALINALTKLKATSAVPQLTAALDDNDPQVARAAARALQRLKH